MARIEKAFWYWFVLPWFASVRKAVVADCCKEAAYLFDCCNPFNRLFNSAGFARAWRDAGLPGGLLDGRRVEALLTRMDFVRRDSKAHWEVL